MKAERWRPVVGFEGFYEVSDRGRVRSLDRQKWAGKSFYKLGGRILSPGTDSGGYQLVVLCANSKKTSVRVHSIVVDSFRGRRRYLKDVNHINGVKTDNRVGNLERCSRGDNMRHAYKIGLRKSSRRHK